jgi:MEMO1 family protein
VAARAYDALRPARGIARRVILLGPVHRVPVRGLALPAAQGFDTPLGRIAVDAAAREALRGLPQVVTSDPAHAMEHSLEVQLPFLQKALGDISVVPLAVGMASVQDVAGVLERLWGGIETLVVLSTDLSHYLAYDRAKSIDGATIERICAFATDIDHEQACGATPLNGLLGYAARRNLSIRLLAACNSGDTAGGKDRVVGYSSFALYEPGADVALPSAGETLLGMARAAIQSRLTGAPEVAAAQPWLRQAGATFVTLTRDGALRGCIGSLEALRPLAEDVSRNAVAAAFHDPRFAALSASEWPHVRMEVSLLSAPRPIRFADEEHLLEQVVAGEDGLIVEHMGRRATFLPQVWESLPDKRRFMDELLRKAGLPSGTRLARCSIARYRVVKWKEGETQ